VRETTQYTKYHVAKIRPFYQIVEKLVNVQYLKALKLWIL